MRHELAAGRGAFLHMATGAANVNGRQLLAGDAVAVEGELAIEVLLFDLA